MLNLFAYVMVFAVALSLAAIPLEHFANWRGRSRRLVWMSVMLGSVVLPSILVLTARPVSIGSSLAEAHTGMRADVASSAVMAAGSESAAIEKPVATRPRAAAWHVPKPSNRSLLVAWGVASGALLAFLSGAAILLQRRVASWQPASVSGRDVLVSRNTGPALVGVLRPRIVVPRWFLDEAADKQVLILQHEAQHIAAFDPLLMRMALLLAIALPWNLPLWWQLRRLRFAIELDCDARVLLGGAEAGRYGEVLLEVTRRATAMPVGVIAMSEPVSALERRIRCLERVRDPHTMARMFAALLIAAASIGGAAALEVPPIPLAPVDVLVHAAVLAAPQAPPEQSVPNLPDASGRPQPVATADSASRNKGAPAGNPRTLLPAPAGATAGSSSHEGDMDMRQLIALAAGRFNKRFVVDPRIAGSVDMAGLAPASLTYHAFLEVLGVHGFVAMPSGDVVIIVPQELARTIASPIVHADNIEGDDSEVVTVLIPMADGQAAVLNVIVRQLVSTWGTVLTTPGGKSLIVVEKVANVKRIVALFQEQSKSP